VFHIAHGHLRVHTLQAMLSKELGEGRGSIHGEKREDAEVLALEVHDDLGRSVHETCSSPRKDGQMDS